MQGLADGDIRVDQGSGQSRLFLSNFREPFDTLLRPPPLPGEKGKEEKGSSKSKTGGK